MTNTKGTTRRLTHCQRCDSAVSESRIISTMRQGEPIDVCPDCYDRLNDKRGN